MVPLGTPSKQQRVPLAPKLGWEWVELEYRWRTALFLPLVLLFLAVKKN